MKSPNRRDDGLRWLLFTVMSALALLPAMFTPVVADDFVLPFNQILNGGLNPITITRWAVTAAPSAGHFNFLGQIAGGATGLIWMVLISALGITSPTVLAFTKLIVFMLSACAAARFLRVGLANADVEVSRWRSRTITAVVLFATLQVHIPWSNDPVTSFPASGFGSMAIGFCYLAFVASSTNRLTWGRTLACAVAGCAAILYYEINLAAVAAAAPLMIIWALKNPAAERRLIASKAVVALGIPAVMTMALQLWVGSLGASYDGTTLASDGSVSRTFSRAMVSSLPAVAWSKSREWLSSPIPIRAIPVVVVGVLLVALWYLARRSGVRPLLHRPLGSMNRLVIGLVSVSPLIYWATSTGIQSLTKKIQDEVVEIGQVYNFYAVGVTCVALVIVIVAIVVPVTPRGRMAIPIVVAMMIGFASVQYLTNAEVTHQMNERFAPNNALLDVYSEQAPVEQRCAALRRWTADPWPNYYENQIVTGLAAGYRKFHGEEFCPGFDRVAEGLAS